jgi:hypothetical protein
MKPNLGLATKARDTVVAVLGRLLADEHVAVTK